MDSQEMERLAVKTPERRFLRVLEQEFGQAPRVAQAVLEEAQCLFGASRQLGPGQIRTILTKRQAGHGRALRDTASVEVAWSVDAGAEDREVLRRDGKAALRRVRLQRLLGEAIEQGGVATQEDVARALQVSTRTIKRDYAHLQAEGMYLPTRGHLHAIGRGQTHKAQIVGRWLRGETYDQLVLHTHHCITSVQRYVQAFVRVMELHRQGFSEGQISLLLQVSVPLVQEYVAVYQQHDAPADRERLAEQLQRLGRASATLQEPQKGGL